MSQPANNSVSQKIERPETDPVEVSRLAEEINAPNFVAALLLQHGIKEKEQARRFFLAEVENPASPEHLLGLTKAISLLEEALKAKEKILVHGDYDVDGIAGAALMYMGLRQCGFEAEWFLPNRFRDGYGITVDNIRDFHRRGVKWIITVDTGISALEEIGTAAALGMRVIITDHHQVPEELPAAEAIINPNQPGCGYSNKDLCGAGIAFQVINELMKRTAGRSSEEFLDLVALASLADVAPMSGENRFLVRKGLRLLEQTQNLGLRQLLRRQDMEGKSLSSSDILFRIVPLLNAPGRLDNPDTSMQLLISEDEAEARKLIEKIHLANTERKSLDHHAVAQAVDQIEQTGLDKTASCLVLGSSDWHEGIIGIVAAKLVDRYCRPAFVLSLNNGIAKGSGRTVEGFNLFQAISGCQDILDKWGGHYFACGFSIKESNIEDFQSRMNTLASESLGTHMGTRIISPAVEIGLEEICKESMTWLKRFEPFGPLNEHPLFYTQDAYLEGRPRVVGEEHLKFFVTNGLARFDAIAFGLGYLARELKPDQKLTMAFYPEWNHFGNRKILQLRVTAIDPGT